MDQKLIDLRGPKTTPLRADPLLEGTLTDIWREYPDPVGELNRIHLEAQLYLRGRDLETCLEMIRSALLMAESHSDHTRAMLDAEASRAQTFLDHRAELTARRVYATGLYLGVVISAAVLTGVAFLTMALIPAVAFGILQDVLVCLGGGAIGAVVSTILRVSNTDSIQYRVIMLRTAAFRIVVGWLFAAALLFLIKGGLITIFNVPTDGTTSFFFWAAVGFLAGFNEVWVQNVVTRPISDSAGTTTQAPD